MLPGTVKKVNGKLRIRSIVDASWSIKPKREISFNHPFCDLMD